MSPTPLSRTSSTASDPPSDSTVTSFGEGSSSSGHTIVPVTPSANTNEGGSGGTTKRTRKRFTNAQLVALEQVFHQTSHPTREQREAVAKETGLELRSVTIWFQNKRQTERKIALCYGPDFKLQETPSTAPTPFPTTGTTNSSSTPVATTGTARNALRPPPLATNASYQRSLRHSMHAHRTQPTTASSTQPRPSLDSVASRIERLHMHSPRTPTRLRTYSSPNHYRHEDLSALWENMSSSTMESPSPEVLKNGSKVKEWEELVELGKKGEAVKRTLEWACAAALVSRRDEDEEDEEIEEALRLRQQQQERRQHQQHQRQHQRQQRRTLKRASSRDSKPASSVMDDTEVGAESEAMGTLDSGGDTEEETEAHEAVTPSSSLGLMDVDDALHHHREWSPDSQASSVCKQALSHRRQPSRKSKDAGHDEEMMNAALVLCGLGKR